MPRTGPQGVTNEDVARRAGVTYIYAPPTNQPAPVDQGALISYLIGGQAPGYGMKYGGFPTAAYGQAAVEGQAFGIADLARQAAQQAAQREYDLTQTSHDEALANRQAVASKYRFNYQQSPLVEAVDYPTDGTGMQKLLAKARLKAAVETQRAGREAELQGMQDVVTSQYDKDIATQVTPSRQLAEAIGAYSPSQLAQQIAVSRYGYDPMLAAGLFGAQTDIAYDTQSQALQKAQLRAQGYNIDMTADEMLAATLSPEDYNAYKLQQANRAYESATKPDYSQQDVALYGLYGTTPSNDAEREIMLDPQFATLVENSKTAMLASKSLTPAAVASQIARNYVNGGGDPARAVLLEDILSRYAFLVQNPLNQVDIPDTAGV